MSADASQTDAACYAGTCHINQIDGKPFDRDKLDSALRKKIEGLEVSLQRAYDRAKENSDVAFHLKGKVGDDSFDYSFTGADLVHSFETLKINYVTMQPVMKGSPAAGAECCAGGVMNLFPESKNNKTAWDQRYQFLHEAIHGTEAGRSLNRDFYNKVGAPQWNLWHQHIYDPSIGKINGPNHGL